MIFSTMNMIIDIVVIKLGIYDYNIMKYFQKYES